MSAAHPESRSLTGRFVRLDPLVDADAPELFEAIARPEVYEFGYGGGVAALPHGPSEFGAELRGHYPFVSGIPFAVRIAAGPAEGRLVGTTSIGDIDTANRGAHIGWTAYSPRVWGTAVNPECKLLLLSHLFDAGFERVKIQTDAVNARSRGAITKLGASFEGVLRHHRLRADGTWRDTAVYSILAEEWPDVRSALQRRLDASEADEVLRG